MNVDLKNQYCLQTIRMLSNFFKVAFRVFMKNSFQTLINIFGLAIGISFSLVIFLYAHKEISYDRFHQHAKRIYRVAVNAQIAGNTMNIAMTSTPLAGTMTREIPEVEEAVRIARFGAWLLRYDSLKYNEDNLIFSDSGFFTLFSFPLLKGSAETVLAKPNSIVLSEKSVKRYFGDADPMGKQLHVENDSTYYTVTGVMKDIPDNSHLHFDMVGALSTFDKMLQNDRWVANYLYTYFLLREGASPDSIKKGLKSIVARHVLPDYRKLLNLEDLKSLGTHSFYHFNLQPLTEIHLESKYAADVDSSGKHLYVYLLIVLAVVILLLSCMNFISLLTAQSSGRALEVGIRKISGSERRSLIQQFLLESSLLAFFALALALLFTELALPAFSKYIGLQLSLGQLVNTQGFILIVALIIVVGIFSGLYPAWYLSSYNPKSVMRNHFEDHPDKGRLRAGFSLLQLYLAVGAVSMTAVIMLQYRYLVNKDRGYDTNNLVVIRRPDALTTHLDQFKKEIAAYKQVISSANASSSMGGGFPRFPFYPEGSVARQNISMSTFLVSFGFDATYRFTMKSGRFFNPVNQSDSSACVINETAVHKLGIQNPIGKTLIQLTEKPGKINKYTIIGVVQDFYFETLENPVRPMIMILMPGNFEGYLSVRISPQNQDSTIQYLKSTWEKYTTAYPFVYYYLDADRREFYKPVQTTARIFVLLSIVTMLMACLSLFAQVSYLYNRKQRKIGIQKTMGASNLHIMKIRLSRVGILVLIASVFAWFSVYYLARLWLADYAYHIALNFGIFIAATVIVSLFSFLAIYYHTCRMACANPGEMLKYE
jgi:putative ABC transport system permease protein